jgi:drug/metabolite transporter (DMT)-like permease
MTSSATTFAALVKLVAGAVIISFAPVLVRAAHIGPMGAAFYRMLIGGAILGAVVLIRGQQRWTGTKHVVLCAVASVFLALDLGFWHKSIHYIGPGMATILVNFQVLFFAGFGIAFLGERLNLRLVAAIPLALLGLYLIFGTDSRMQDESYRLGIILGVLGAVFYAVHLIVLRSAQKAIRGDGGPVLTVALLSFFAAVFLVGVMQVEGESFQVADTWTWMMLLAYAVGTQVIGWVLISSALPHIETSRAGLILLLQPALAFFWDILFFSRATAALEFFGVFVALSAVYLGSTKKK